MWYFIALVWVALVAGIFWFYGRARRKARSVRERELDALMLEAQGLIRRAAVDPRPADSAIPVEVAPPAATAGSAYAQKSRLLDKSDALIYLLLRTGLPEHEIFAALTLADVLEPAATLRGFEREQATRRLAAQRLDFVVCDKSLRVVAVVLCAQVADGGAAQHAIESALCAGGIRWVRLDAAALPRHHQIRALIYDETTPTGG